MSLYVVSDEDDLYGDRIGELVSDNGNLIHLMIDTEIVSFERDGVQRIIL